MAVAIRPDAVALYISDSLPQEARRRRSCRGLAPEQRIVRGVASTLPKC